MPYKLSELDYESVRLQTQSLYERENRSYVYALNYEKTRHILETRAMVFNPFENIMTGMPVVVGNSGGSLDAGAVEKIRESGVPVIAVDNAAKKLVEGGVKPFLIVNLDYNPVCAEMLEGCVDSKTLVAVPPYVSKELLEVALRGRVLLFSTIPVGEPDGFLDRFNQHYKVAKFNGCATVGTVAASIAVFLGCNPIVFAGLDLSYESKEECPPRKNLVDCGDGRWTIWDFAYSKLWYDMAFTKIEDGSRKIQTSLFMPLEGTEAMELEKALMECGEIRGNATWRFEKVINKFFKSS